MNEELRFSWGHILAFLALIFIAYVTFMGITYLTLGNFGYAGIGALACVVLLAVFLLGAQVKKGAPTKFYKSIIWERILLLMSPVVLVLAFYPYNHFWSVLDQEDEIVKDFNTSISYAHEIFDEYESYANKRIDTLSYRISKLSSEQQQNRTDELRLLLLSKNYDKLKSEAKSWIDNASKSSTVWNVFLLGNVDNIIEAVGKWTSDLSTVSSKHLKCEDYDVVDFGAECNAKQKTVQGLANLKSKYANKDYKINIVSLVTMIICFLMLLCPYFIQERHAANCERFWDFWIFSYFYNSKEDSGFTHVEPEPIIKPKKNYSHKGNIENHNNEVEDNNKPICKPKTSKGAPV